MGADSPACSLIWLGTSYIVLLSRDYPPQMTFFTRFVTCFKGFFRVLDHRGELLTCISILEQLVARERSWCRIFRPRKRLQIYRSLKYIVISTAFTNLVLIFVLLRIGWEIVY